MDGDTGTAGGAGTAGSMGPCPLRLATAAQAAAWGAGLAVALWVEGGRLREIPRTGLAGWLADVNVDTTLPFLLLLAAPLFWRMRRPLIEFGRRRRDGVEVQSPGATGKGRRGWGIALPPWILALLVAAASWGVSASIAARPVGGGVAARFGDLPPAFHDEYSYLFQAKTFLAGRASYPSHPDAPELFDQMHVLNEGRFASRYFPGAGAWMAPFVALERPYRGQWLAGTLAAFFVFWAGRELAGNGVGFLAGLLMAAAPGVGIFSNLLLAHHPALMGLCAFLAAFLRMMRTRHWRDAALAGAGLSFAMLCRPMTAAGFALPFGVWLAWTAGRGWVGAKRGNGETGRPKRCLEPCAGPHDRGFQTPVRTQEGTGPGQQGAASSPRLPLSPHPPLPVSLSPPRTTLVLMAAIAVPLVAGFALLLAHNRAITGSAWVTPYQLFTDLYSPRHVYGFDNVRRGEERLGPKVLEEYDRWAENLTPSLAARNVRDRLVASWQSTLGVVPLAMAAAVFLIGVPAGDRRWWLVGAGIVSLHAAHVPYWYVGIRNWHYVFESAPLWVLVFAGATGRLLAWWRAGERPWMPAWWAGMTAAALLPWYVPLEPLWPVARVQAEVQEIAFSRRMYAAFRQEVERLVDERPALLLIDERFKDRHIDFVVNSPDLEADLLYGRLRPETEIGEIVRLFPGRAVYALVANGDRKGVWNLALDRGIEDSRHLFGPEDRSAGLRLEPAGRLAISSDRQGTVFRLLDSAGEAE